MLEAVALYLVVQLVFYAVNPDPAPEGYTKYDPCFRCGDDWEFYPAHQSGDGVHVDWDAKTLRPQHITITD